jgi:hypothetical protein
VDEKLKALKQYRRAKGLCDRCAEKWSPCHRCAGTVQLHAIHELWELLPDEELLDDSSDSVQVEDSGQLCMVLSEAVVVGKESSRSMRLLGQIQGHDVLILVDSGSSHTFISATLANDLSGVSQLHSALAVKVANGNSLICSLQLQQAKWEVQGLNFTLTSRFFHCSTLILY